MSLDFTVTSKDNSCTFTSDSCTFSSYHQTTGTEGLHSYAGCFSWLDELVLPGIDELVLLSGLDELVLLSALDELVLLSGHDEPVLLSALDEPVLLSVQALAVPEVVPTNKNVLELNRQKKRCGQK